MADLGGVFDAHTEGFLPDRLTLKEDSFKAVFDSLRSREEATGRKLTFEAFSEEVGINERVLRRARAGQITLARFQVLKMAERLGCPAGKIAGPANAVKKAQQERNRREMLAWPVPLREVDSWVRFLDDLVTANIVRTEWRDDVLSLAAAPGIDAFKAAVTYASQVMKTNPAIAAATLKDAAEDLQTHGLHVLTGRYVARRRSLETDLVGVEIEYVLEVWVRRETEDLKRTVDRSHEPLTTSDEEDFWIDDFDVTERWLAWEGKRRLALWPEHDAE